MRKKIVFISIVIFIVAGLYINSIFQRNSDKVNSVQIDVKYKLGKRIYERNCISCHDAKMIEYSTAPPLGGITKRREKKWLYNYTRNSVKMFNDGDTIAIKLRSENFGLMTSFPNLNEEKLDAVYYYIEKNTINTKVQKQIDNYRQQPFVIMAHFYFLFRNYSAGKFYIFT